MNKRERLFYFAIILLEFALIILFYSRLGNCLAKRGVSFTENSQHGRRLYSFPGTTKDGKPQWLHFNAYSPDYYILVNVSNECSHCTALLEHMNVFFDNKTIDDTINIYLVVPDEHKGMTPSVPPCVKYLEASAEDRVQLGMETPSIWVVNGQGDILYNRKGFFPGIFAELLKQIAGHKNSNWKSTALN